MDSGPDRFAAELKSRGLAGRPRHLPDSTRSAAEAAAAIGCTVAEIAKSIVFRLAVSDRPVMAVASGANRVDTAKLEALCGEKIANADANFVRSHTGYAIGGVPPFGHREDTMTFIDDDLFQYERIWAAAGGSFDVFPTTAQELLDASAGRRADIRHESP